MSRSYIGYNIVQSSPNSRGVEPSPADLDLKNIEIRLDWKPGRSSLSIRQAAKPAKLTKKK
jgi:hypothetical protein